MPILEHQYHPVDYRNVCDLRKVSYAARALYLELFCAASKTPHGVVDVRPALLEEESGIPGSQIPALLVELVTAGLIAYDAKNRIAYHTGSALRHCDNAKNRNGWIKIAAGLPAGPVKMAFESELAGVAWQSDTPCIPYPDRMHTVSQPSAYGIDNSNGNSNSNANRNGNGNDEPSVAKATDTSAIAAEPRAIAIEPQEPQASEPQPVPHFVSKAFDPHWNPLKYLDRKPTPAPKPDPLADSDEELAIDWGKVQEQAHDPQTNRADFRVKPNVTPEAALRVAQAEAKRAGILPAEPQQLAMDLPAGKAKRELTPTQQDAIFAKRKMLEVVNHWNETMAGKNAPCVPKTVMAMAGTLMGNFAKFQHREPLEDARWLFDWAMAVDPYHSGRQGRPWTLQAWLTADHLSAVFAAYRTHKGDGKMLTMDIDRTIRDWRLAVETAELNNKISEANNAY